MAQVMEDLGTKTAEINAKCYDELIDCVTDAFQESPLWKEHNVHHKAIVAQAMANLVLYISDQAMDVIGAKNWQAVVNEIHQQREDAKNLIKVCKEIEDGKTQ
jgi:hypothetical protein